MNIPEGIFQMVGLFVDFFSFWKPDRFISGFSERLKQYKQVVILFQEKLFFFFNILILL